MIKELILSTFLVSASGLLGVASPQVQNSLDLEESTTNRSVTSISESWSDDFNYRFVPRADCITRTIYGVNNVIGTMYLPPNVTLKSKDTSYQVTKYNNTNFDLPIISENVYTDTLPNSSSVYHYYPFFQIYFDNNNYFQLYAVVLSQVVNGDEEPQSLVFYYNYRQSENYLIKNYASYSFLGLRYCASSYQMEENYHLSVCNFPVDDREQSSTKLLLWSVSNNTQFYNYDFDYFMFNYLCVDYTYYTNPDVADIYYDQGYNIGYQDGFQNGDTYGYNRGLETHTDQDLLSLFLTIADTPMLMLRSMFDFNLLGVALFGLITTLLTVTLAIFVFKKVLK